jgi:phosphoribosyl-ATP pyrophosphohydrolase
MNNVMEMVRDFANITRQKPDADLYFELMMEEFSEFVISWNDDEGNLKELADLLYVAYGYANARGWNLDEAVRRVHENNVGRCVRPDGSIIRREDGKIIKNKDYPKVSLKDLVS